MGCAFKQSQHGFTLVEISIVMIIVGLLIGGTFSGLKLIENMQINKTVQDLKAIESTSLTFKDTYARLPGDIVNPAARLPNCTIAPCATGGNGNRILGVSGYWASGISNSDENYTFWHHLQASGLTNLSIQNTLDMTYGVGSPSTGEGFGLRVGDMGWASTCTRADRAVAYLTSSQGGISSDVSCDFIGRVDKKIDDGAPNSGQLNGALNYHCVENESASCNASYVSVGKGVIMYDMKGF